MNIGNENRLMAHEKQALISKHQILNNIKIQMLNVLNKGVAFMRFEHSNLFRI